MDHARLERVRQRTQEVMHKAKSLFGVDVSAAQIKFDLTGRVAGLAICKYCVLTKQKRLTLRFNCEIINSDQLDHFVDTVPAHEVAHLVCALNPALGRNHDAGWRRVCLALGGDGNRTHTFDVVVRGRWDYVTDMGHKVSVSKKHHAYVQAGGTLRFKKGLGTISKSSPHAPSGQLKVTPKTDGTLVIRTQPKQAPVPKPAQVPSRTKTVNDTGELTWAEKVRRLIRAQKALGVSMDTVIVLAIQDLGMTRERARSCVKAHWEKV